jgi:hypothetical protein
MAFRPSSKSAAQLARGASGPARLFGARPSLCWPFSLFWAGWEGRSGLVHGVGDTSVSGGVALGPTN